MSRRYKNRKQDTSIIYLLVITIMIYYFKRKNITFEQFSKIDTKVFVYIFGAIICIFILKKLLSRVKKLFKQTKEKKKYLNSRIREIDQMSGEEFELLLKYHFEQLGYKVNLTTKSHDYGGDLVVSMRNIKTVVQVKRYKNKVDQKAVREALGAKGIYKASRAMVITNSYFTKSAIELAKANEVELWDRNKLIKTFQIT